MMASEGEWQINFRNTALCLYRGVEVGRGRGKQGGTEVRPIKTWVAYLADQRWNPSSRFNIAGETLSDFQLAKKVKSDGL
jgi:hypothetical protein